MLKKSKQRDGILDVLSKKNYHPSAEEIYERVKGKLPGIGIATVYRNLEQLIKGGRIVRIDVPGKPACYDGNIEEHYHITCTHCGDIEDVWINFNLIEHIAINKAFPRFELSGYRIDFRGICDKCNKRIQ